MKDKLPVLLAQIRSCSELEPILQQMRAADPDKATGIDKALRTSCAASRKALEDDTASADRLRYGLFRNATEIQAFAAPYRRLAQSMAEREKALWQHAFECTERFFAQVNAALDVYFREKLKAMEEDIQVDSSWYTGLRDTAKKSGELVNLGRAGFARAWNMVSDSKMGGDPVLDTRSVTERTLDHHMPQKRLAEDMEKILEASAECFKENWEKVIEQNTPSVKDLGGFADAGARHGAFQSSFQLGAAEGTLLAGVGVAVAATLGLAAGWHTVVYALLNVFPPAAAFAAIATVLVAVFTKETATESRLVTVRKAVENYSKTLLTLINTETIEDLEGRTLREAMHEQSKIIVANTVKAWWHAIGGNLDFQHLNGIASAVERHLQMISECLDLLDEQHDSTQQRI